MIIRRAGSTFVICDFVLREILRSLLLMSAAEPAPDGKVKQWLMERVGHADAPLGQKWVQHIAQLFIEGEWDESDIVKSHKGREGAKEVWTQILAAAADRMEKPGPSGIAVAKALRSVLMLSPLYSAEATGDVFLTRVTLEDPPYEPISSSSLRGKGVARATEPASLSVEEVEDMAAQGATTPAQLFALSVGMQLAKKATVSECVGGGYGSSPHMADGIKRAVKGGMVTLQRLLEEAMVSGDLLDLDRQITRTVQRWMADPSDAFYMNAGSRLMMLWSKARALCPDDMRVAACMVHLMLDEYLGRGLPRLTDSEMAQQARYRYSKGACAPSRPPSHRSLGGGGRAPPSFTAEKVVEFGYDTSDTASSVGGSSVQSAASSALQSSIDGLTKLMADRFDQSASQVKSISDRLTRVESKHGEMAASFSKFKSNPAPERGTGSDGRRTCFKCGSAEHVVQDCPLGKKPKAGEDTTEAKDE